MSSEEVHKLFDLLEQLYQGKKKSRDKATLAIWATVFKPWTYEQVRDAAVRRARVSRYFPDPSELAEYLPPVAGPAPCMKSPEHDAVMELRERWLWLLERRREAGLPKSGLEARMAGMTCEQWLDGLDKAGLSLRGGR